MSTRESLPSRLRQATDNFELLPVVSFGEWVRRIQVLCDETAVEIERLSHVEPAIEQLTKEREVYRMRWLSCAQPGQSDRNELPSATDKEH